MKRKITQPIKNDLENMLDIAETAQDRNKFNDFKVTLHLLEELDYEIADYRIKGNEVDKRIPTLEGIYK